MWSWYFGRIWAFMFILWYRNVIDKISKWFIPVVSWRVFKCCGLYFWKFLISVIEYAIHLIDFCFLFLQTSWSLQKSLGVLLERIVCMFDLKFSRVYGFACFSNYFYVKHCMLPYLPGLPGRLHLYLNQDKKILV